MRSLASKTNVQPPDSDYPFGRIKDNPGNGTGTPVNELVYGDFHQFFEKLMAEAGIVANGLPDNDYSGFQLFDALFAFVQSKIDTLNPEGLITKVVEMGPQNLTLGGGGDTTFTVPHGLTYPRSIRSISAFVISDAGSNAHNFLIDISDGTINNPIGVTNLLFNAKTGGYFDNPAFSSTAFNRGWVTIQYDPNFTP